MGNAFHFGNLEDIAGMIRTVENAIRFSVPFYALQIVVLVVTEKDAMATTPGIVQHAPTNLATTTTMEVED